MRNFFLFAVILLAVVPVILANDKPIRKSSVVFNKSKPSDSLRYKTPAHRQGVICNFEDQLSRKKVPLNFQLGNSKY